MNERCKSCAAPIYWAVTQKGRNIPIDKQPVPDGNIRLEPRHALPSIAIVVNDDSRAICRPPCPRPITMCPPYGEPCPVTCPRGLLFRSHFATCPNANKHRKKK